MISCPRTWKGRQPSSFLGRLVVFSCYPILPLPRSVAAQHGAGRNHVPDVSSLYLYVEFHDISTPASTVMPVANPTHWMHYAALQELPGKRLKKERRDWLKMSMHLVQCNLKELQHHTFRYNATKMQGAQSPVGKCVGRSRTQNLPCRVERLLISCPVFVSKSSAGVSVSWTCAFSSSTVVASLH